MLVLLSKRKYFILVFFMLFFSLISVVRAGSEEALGMDYSNVDYVDKLGMSFADDLGLPGGNLIDFDLRNIIINILKYIMTFFGIIAVSVIMLAGFKMMVSNGSEDAMRVAKSMIIGSVIGMSTVVGAYAIVNMVVVATSKVVEGNF